MPFASNILSPTHLVVVFLVVLLVFGTKKLPELGRGMGAAMREFKDGVTGRSPALEEPSTVVDSPSGGADQSSR